MVVILNNTDTPQGDDAAYAKAIFMILSGISVTNP
jgi:hypothetical protein